MRKLKETDFYWLLQSTEKVSRDVNMRTLGEVYTQGEIDLTKVKQVLEIRLFNILKERIKFMSVLEINFTIYTTNDTHECDNPIFSRKLKTTCNTLLQAIMESLEKHEDACAIQVYMKNVESATFDNFVFFVS